MFRNDIRNKLFLLFILATVIPMISSIVITYFYTKDSLEKKAIKEDSELLYQVSMNIEKYMDELNEASISVYYEPIKKSTSLYNIIRYGGSDFSSIAEIYRSLQTILHLNEGIYQVHLFMQNSKSSYLMVNNNLKTAGEDKNPLYDINKNVYIEPIHDSHSYGKIGLPYVSTKKIITFHRELYLTPDTTPIGTISFDINLEYFSKLMNSIGKDNSKLLILDKDGNIYYSSEGVNSFPKEKTPKWFNEMIASKSSKGSLEYVDEQSEGLLLYENMNKKYMNWYIVKQTPFTALYKEANKLALINTFFLFLFLAVAILIAFLVSSRFTSPIKELIQTINKVETGDLHVRIKSKRTDEIGILMNRFSNMMETIDTLIVNKYKLELANNTNQLKALQAQINPHFLNNVLQSIATLALHQQQINIYKSIVSLGRIMDYHMDVSDVKVPLIYEINYIHTYLDLQKQRFKEQFHYCIEVDPKANQILVPKMLLLPLVENYFKHGAHVNRKGKLKIECKIIGNNCYLVVQDNGTGMETLKLLKLQKKINRVIENSETFDISDHIGLMNVYSRLKLLYGENTKMEINNVEPYGFIVVIVIPNQ
ncbi:sensor histidine kinase [Lederbergia ruris]|uniref:sensor histidine kinase n=1 Tax=Lederbergia ruris TaxID=217495 RepID=UPI0039A2349D